MIRPMSKCRNILAVLLTTFLTLMPSLALHAQTMTVTGVVKDSGGVPLAGVSVFVVGTKTGVVTGYEGDYKINVAKGKTLRFSFIGFETQDIKVDKSKIDLQMKEEALTMETVVVTGYSSVELRKSTGAVAVLSSDKLKDNPFKSVDQLLQGQLAGVDVKLTSGRPGAASKVRVAHVIRMPMRHHGIVYRSGSDVPLQIPGHDLAAEQIASGIPRYVLYLFRTVEVAGIIHHRGAVRKTVEHILTAPGVHEMQIQFTLPPQRKRLADFRRIGHLHQPRTPIRAKNRRTNRSRRRQSDKSAS